MKRPGAFTVIVSGLTILGLATVGVFAKWVPAEAAQTIVGNNTLISVNSIDGNGGNAHSSLKAISEDGNKVLFTSASTNLPAANSGGYTSPFIRDVASGTTVKVNTSASGVPGDASVFYAIMSRTGRYVVFDSYASNLIDGTTTVATQPQVYLKDMQTGNITQLSTDIAGAPAGNGLTPLNVSDDGKFVTFTTKYASYYIPSIRTGYVDIIMLDRTNSTWSLIDTPASGSPQNTDAFAGVYAPASCDGSLLVFISTATNLVAGFSGSGYHVYLADLRNAAKLTDLTAGITANSYNASISCNGRYITFTTYDRTFVTPTPTGMDANGHVVRYDRLTGNRQYVDVNGTTYGGGTTSAWGFSSVSDKGDVVTAYRTTSLYVYLKHLSDSSGTLEHIQKAASGTYPYAEQNVNVLLSANGKYIAYRTLSAQNLGLISAYTGFEEVVRTETGL